MALEVQMRHPQTGLLCKGYVGFSWTTFFFGPFPPLFRGDFGTFFTLAGVIIILGFPTCGVIAPFIFLVWAFYYNRHYTRKLIEQGYLLDDTPERNALAAEKLGVVRSEKMA